MNRILQLEDIRTNFEFLKRNHLLENLAVTANVLYHHQIILMGTPAFQQLKNEGRLQNVNSFMRGQHLTVMKVWQL